VGDAIEEDWQTKKKKEQEKEERQKQKLETENSRYNAAKTKANGMEQLTSIQIKLLLRFHHPMENSPTKSKIKDLQSQLERWKPRLFENP
jgi:hypothetical protein